MPMERMFDTHRVRKSREALPIWTVTTLDPGGLNGPEKTILPGVWEAHPRLKSYRGRAVYTQEIACGGRVRLWLGGVSFRARVWLDDALLCAHYGGYTGFEALAENVSPGTHTLRIEADNRFGPDSALHIPNDYYTYGGVNRPVVIEEVNDTYIAWVHVTPKKVADGWHAHAEARLCNLAGEPKARTLCLEIAGEQAEMPVTLPAGEAVTVSADILCPNVETWTPNHPALTYVTVALLEDGVPVDDLTDRFGFREVRTEGGKILLNGVPLRLKGFNRHEETADFGLSVPVEEMLRDIRLMKDLGANCVRTCHYPNDPRFLDLCDETGLLVWEESHARGLNEKQMRHPAFMEQLTLCTREMAEQHYNHPSVFVWGCLNECADDTEYGAACYREIFALLRALDASRPVTAALLERHGGRIFDAPDVIGVNIYPGWYYDGAVSESLQKKKAEIASGGGTGKPLIVSEIGAGAVAGYHDPFGRTKWSEERQAEILREQIEGVLEDPEVCGLFLWQFADCRVTEGGFAGRPRCYNNKGVVDEYRRPKLSYQAVKELFHRF